ncbi:MAG: HDIG domain-containing metalloprotein [Thermodesulfovibrionaceae bacterium]
MKNMKNDQQLKPFSPDRSYLRKFIERLKKQKNDKERKIPFIETSLLIPILIWVILNCFLIHDFSSGISSFVGNFFIVFLLLTFFYKDLKRYKPSYIKNKKMLFLLGFLLSFTIIISRVFEHLLSVFAKGFQVDIPMLHLFGIPFSIGSVLVVIIFDFHTAITFSLVLSLVLGLWLKNPLISIYVFIGSLIGAFSLLRMKKRNNIINAGIFISLVNYIVALSILLIEGSLTLNSFYFSALFSTISGVSVTALCFILLPILEKFFNITTSVSLIELLDMDHPLLSQLATYAPGTYHHCITVSTLAEAAAEVVGVNPLFAKVASYYHDIGKIRIPEYYVENQTGCISKHDKLSPHLSSMIIISHVKDGVELAKEYNLPEMINDVIQQHPGTTLVTYFYQKALKESEIPPLEQDYRYPGPKPQSKLAALIMLADAVEAASRTLEDPTPARISNLIDKIIKNIFLDGQLDECEITLKDLSEIKKRFEYILTGIFHRRITYPTLPKKEQIA